MRKVLVVCTFVAGLAFATVAAAEDRVAPPGSGQPQGSQGQGSSGAMAATSAPVGHRQPRPADLPPDARQNESTTGGPAADGEDAALNRALRSICCGC